MERLRGPNLVFGMTDSEMPFAGRTADHQGFDGEKAGEAFPESINCVANWASHTLGQILTDKKERLNRAHPSGLVLKNEEVIVERLGEGRPNEFVEPVILELVLKRSLPGGAITQFFQCHDGRETARGSHGLAA